MSATAKSVAYLSSEEPAPPRKTFEELQAADIRENIIDTKRLISEAVALFCYIESRIGDLMRNDDLTRWATEDMRETLGKGFHHLDTCLMCLKDIRAFDRSGIEVDEQ